MTKLPTLNAKVTLHDVHKCAHCGDPCPDTEFVYVDTHFCCLGCKNVYEILHENDLCTFYDLDEAAGLSQKKQKNAKQYAYLADADVAARLIEFENENTAQVTFYLPQMHCVSCIWLLEHLYKLDPGVTASKVNFLKKTCTIQFDSSQTQLQQIAALLASIGYAPEINLGDVHVGSKQSVSRRLLYQIGIAGFVFGNVMLFSFPEYVGMQVHAETFFASVFGYMSLAMSLPVLLYSAQDYFVGAWLGIKHRRLTIDVPLCLALGSLFLNSVYEILTQTGAGYLDSFAGLTFLLLIGKWMQQATWNELSFERDYRSFFPISATVLIDHEEVTKPLYKLLPGDTIMVRNEEIIPADGILLKGQGQIDYSFVSGESAPILVQCGDRIYAGGKQLGSSIEIGLTNMVSQSKLTQLWNQSGNDLQKQKYRLHDLADQAALVFSWIILVAGGSAFAYWTFIGDFSTGLKAFTSVMIVACPCTIALSIPFTLGNVIRILGRNGLYIKNAKTVEAFQDIETVVFDKTGTITQLTAPDFNYQGAVMSEYQKSLFLSLARHSNHPMSRLICQHLTGAKLLEVQGFTETPGVGIAAWIDNQFVRIEATKQHEEQTKKGTQLSINEERIGVFAYQASLRPDLPKVLDYFKKLSTDKYGYTHLALLSGDNDQSRTQMEALFGKDAQLHFFQQPQDKLAFVKAEQQNGRQVLVLGDGLNDAGALQESHLGIVVTEHNNNFTPACDAILLSDSFARLPDFVDFARKGVRVVHWSYGISFLYNIVGLTYAMSGQLSPLIAAILMPTSSISIVLFGIGISTLIGKRKGLIN